MMKDCRYYRNNTDIRGCTILKKLVCRNKKCNFYHKREQQKNDAANKDFESRDRIQRE